MGATVLLEKIAGAAAEQGRTLQQVADIARRVNANGRSMGLALTSCTVPAAGKPTFELGEDEMDLASASTGSPVGNACHSPALERSRRCWSNRCWPICPSAPVTR